MRAHRVYGYSPVQQVLMTVNIALRRQLWQLDYFTEGSIRDALIGVPQGWTPDQIKQFQDSATLPSPACGGGKGGGFAGDLAKRRGVRSAALRPTDDGLYAAGVTVVNDDGGLDAAVNRYLRTLDGGNPVFVEFRVEIQSANGTDSYLISVSDDKLPVYGWKSVPLADLIRGPGVVKIWASNRVPYLTTVIAGASRVQPK